MFSDRLLKIGESLHLTATDDSGQEIATAFGHVTSATKRERTKDDGASTELVFVAKVT
jgi:hypothetical protein